METNSDILDNLGFAIYEISGTAFTVLDLDSLVTLLEIPKNDFFELFEKVRSKAKNYGLARAFKASSFLDEPSEVISVTGIYIFLTIAIDYKKYKHLEWLIPYFKEEALKDLLLYFAHNHNKTKKKTNNIPEEFRIKSEEDYLNLRAKKVDANLRKPDFDLVINKDHQFYSKNIVVTGNFKAWPLREDLVKLITSHGGHVKTSVNKATDYVIAGSGAGPAKLKTIGELGIPILNELEVTILLGVN